MIRCEFHNIWIQKLLLVAFIVAIFWHGLWAGVPRADQVMYLHQIHRFTDLGDILLNSLSFNRTLAVSPADSILYRPLLFLQLGSFYYLFGYNFFFWQLASLVLHILVVLGLHTLLMQGSLKNTGYPLLLSMSFGSSFLGSECVLWSHISGYLTFSLMSVCSILFLIKYFSTKKEGYAWVSLFSGFVSEFLFELGIVLNLLIAAVFLYNWLSIKSERDLKWTLFFLAGALVYPILSIFDLWSLGIIFTSKINQIDYKHEVLLAIKTFQFISFHKLLLGIWYAVIQILFWLIGWVLPNFYNLQVGNRLAFRDFNLSELSLGLNFIIVSIYIIAIYYLFKTKNIISAKFNQKTLLTILCLFLFIFADSFVIAYGRSVPRGLMYEFKNDLYHSYLIYLAIMIGIALFTLNYGNADNFLSKNQSNYNLTQNGKIYFNKIFIFILLIIIISNACCTFKNAAIYRYKYSATDQMVINTVKKWLKENGKVQNAYFRVDQNCLKIDAYGIKIKCLEGKEWSRPISKADILWPEKSFWTNVCDIKNNQKNIYDIKCPEN